MIKCHSIRLQLPQGSACHIDTLSKLLKNVCSSMILFDYHISNVLSLILASFEISPLGFFPQNLNPRGTNSKLLFGRPLVCSLRPDCSFQLFLNFIKSLISLLERIHWFPIRSRKFGHVAICSRMTKQTDFVVAEWLGSK